MSARTPKVDRLEPGKLYTFSWDDGYGSASDRRNYGTFIEVRTHVHKGRRSWQPDRTERLAAFEVVGWFDSDGRAVTRRGPYLGAMIGQVVERSTRQFETDPFDPETNNRDVDQMLADRQKLRDDAVEEVRKGVPILRQIEALYAEANDLPYGLRQALYGYEGGNGYRAYTDEEVAEHLAGSNITVRLEDLLPVIARLLGDPFGEEADHG